MNYFKNPFDPLKDIFQTIWNNIEKNKKENELLIYLIRFLIIFVIISFILYLFLKFEKPGFLHAKNYFFIFFLAILPSMLNGFCMGYFHLYLESSANEYVENMISKKTFHQLGLSKGDEMTSSEFDKLQNIINLKSIIISTLSMALSTYLSNFLRLIIDKGVIQDLLKLKMKKKKTFISAEEYIQQKDNPLVSFLGVIIGGILFTILYFVNLQRYLKGKTFLGPNKLIQKAYEKQLHSQSTNIS